jgi:hypothetical protein
MLRYMRESAIRTLGVLVLMAVAAGVGDAAPCSDFQDGTLQGWTKDGTFNGNLWNPGTGGNPDGYMYCEDTMAGGGTLWARAPSAFTGDLSAYRGLQWDEYLAACTPPPTYPTFPILTAIIDGDTTSYREKNRPVGTLNQWRTRYVSFDSTAWERASGTAWFRQVIRDVDMLDMNFDCNTQCRAEAGIDNIRLVGPDPAQSSVPRWDAYGHAFVSPGTASKVDTVLVTVRDCSGAPVPEARVEIRFFGCTRLCIDYPDAGLSGTTGEDGSVVLDPRVGGCDDCTIQVTANGIVLRSYTKIVSTDWNGILADGFVDAADVTWFASAMQSQAPCGDYDGNGKVGPDDYQLLMAAFMASDANLYPCYPYPDQGACCFPGGACLVTTAAACMPPAAWHGEWYACLPNPCSESQGACCSLAGTCTITTFEECLPPGVWHGEWPTCEPNPCPVPVPGACCAPSGDCRVTLPADCTPPNTWNGESPTCEPNPCISTPVGHGPSRGPGGLPAILQAPNPMRVGTAQEILFYVPRSGSVSLKAYDTTGALVCTIASGSFEAGVHRVTWPGSGGFGAPNRAGAYLLRLSAAQGSDVWKIIRLR